MNNIIKITLVSLLAVVTATAEAQQQDKMRVILKDGTVAEYLMSDVERVELQTTQQTPGQKVQGLGGTIAEAIDLALPSGTLWADHNAGAEYVDETGAMLVADATELSAWGTEWAVPTIEQWQELYDNCSWEWVVRNGIEGRLLKSRANGATLFLPASGVNISGDVLVSGAIGVYWTSSHGDANTTSSLGLYFDSANIYRMEYPNTNTFAVRFVKASN